MNQCKRVALLADLSRVYRMAGKPELKWAELSNKGLRKLAAFLGLRART